MPTLPGPIPDCLLGCKTFPWLTRENLGEEGKRLWHSRTLNFYRNCCLPISVLITGEKQANVSQRKPEQGLLSTALTAEKSLSFQQEGTLKGQYVPSPTLAPMHFMQKKRSGVVKEMSLSSYLVTKISTRVYSKASICSVSTSYVPG